MILEFSVANFRSINTRCVLSMLAKGISDEPRNNVVNVGVNKALKTAVIYGANSSGKSNVVKSMAEMCNIVSSSVKLNFDDDIDYEPFLLTTEMGKPSLLKLFL